MPSTLITALLAASLVPAVAAARPEHRRDGSVWVGAQRFPTLADYHRSQLFRESGARCGSDHGPRPLAPLLATDCSLDRTTIDPAYTEDDQVFVIQVVFHIIQKTDGTGAISAERIASQMKVLNEDYSALAGTAGAQGINTRIKFVLARRDPEGRPTTGIETITSDAFFVDPGIDVAASPMKQALAWDPDRYLNIYTNDAAGWLGFARFPQLSAGTVDDGIVLKHPNVGHNPLAEPFHLGRTLTHEVGHYLGLLHTFQDAAAWLAHRIRPVIASPTPFPRPRPHPVARLRRRCAAAAE